jgi:lipoprotein-releasing system permease protein
VILSRHERMIARRYLLPGKGEGFIFLVAGISLFAVTLGVAALLVVMSVLNGFRVELFDKIVGLNGHAVVQGYGGQLADWPRVLEDARNTPGVTRATPLIEQPLMASYEGRVEGVLVRGMPREAILQNSGLRVVGGKMQSLAPGSDTVAVGSRLAESLGAKVGGRITLVSPQGRSTPFGTVPRIVSYTVGAIFEVGVYDYDKAFVMMPLEDAQTFMLMGENVAMIEIQTEDPDRVGEILEPLAASIMGRGVILDWRSLNRTLFEALEVERVAMIVVLSIIIVVAVFNILSSLIMLGRAKTRDIAILRTMGATRKSVLKVFMTVGTTIGALGVAAGMLLGAILLHFRQSVVRGVEAMTGQNLWDPSIRFLTELPARTDPFEVAAIAVMALFFSFAATLYPAFKASSTDPVQVLRYE